MHVWYFFEQNMPVVTMKCYVKINSLKIIFSTLVKNSFDYYDDDYEYYDRDDGYGSPKAPSSSYDAPSSGYSAPSSGYDAPSSGYDAPSYSSAPSSSYGAPSYGGDGDGFNEFLNALAAFLPIGLFLAAIPPNLITIST